MSDLERINRRIEANRDRMVELQRVLNRIPAIAPESGGKGESEKARTLVDHLRRLGIEDIKALNAPDERVPEGSRPNILATIPGRDSGRSFWIMTHLDVVPPGDETLWETPPFEATERKGRLYGRGVEDNQQGMVSSIFAAASIIEENLIPEVTVKLLFVADEEVGSEKGIKYLLRSHALFQKNDMILVPDMGVPDGSAIEIAEKSILWLKFKTTGRQCHASTPQHGINAFVAGSELVIKLDTLNQIFNERNSLFDPPASTFAPTKKESNIPNVNTIPAEDVFYLDCRILPSVSLDDVHGKIKQFISEVCEKRGVTIDYTTVTSAKSDPTPEDTPLVGSLKKAVKQIYGIDARTIGVGGGTVAAHLRNAGFDTVVWAKLEEQAHAPNEYCVIDNLVGDAKVMATVMIAG